jgi:signal transduction histidine kinase
MFLGRTTGNMLEVINGALTAPGLDKNTYHLYFDSQIGIKKQGEFFVLQTDEFVTSLLNRNVDNVYEQLLERNQRNIEITNGIAISVLIVITISLVIHGSQILDDIQRISGQATLLSGGNWDIPDMEPSFYVELNNVSRTLNVMKQNTIAYIQMQKEKAAMEQNYIQERLQSLQKDRLMREAKIQALQMQINPHFLFNTFNMISRSALLEDHQTTIALIEAISNIMRYTMGRDVSASLKEELEALHSYLRVQTLRFQDTIDFSITNESENDLSSVFIPPLIIQPLVENAIIHGVSDISYRGHIDIRVCGTSGFIVIRITDNGKGMGQKELSRLCLEMEDFPDSGSSRIGVGNVAQRLKHFFNMPGLLSLESKPGEGTAVRIMIPKEGVRAV